jgi:hypothetical protein
MTGVAHSLASRLAITIAVAATAMVALSPSASAQPADPTAPPAFRPCDWVTTDEASDILVKPVTPEPIDDAAGSNGPRCFYAASEAGIGVGISSELFLPTTPTLASTMVANAATEPGAQTVDGLGINATCVYEPNVTPPSTTVMVLLNGGRLYRATAAYEYCDTVEPFARIAVGRLTT